MMKLSSTLLVALLASSQASYLRPSTDLSRDLAAAVEVDEAPVAAVAAVAAPKASGAAAAGPTKKVPKQEEEEEEEAEEEQEEAEEVHEEQGEEEEEEVEDNVVGVNDPDTDLPQYNPECDPVSGSEAERERGGRWIMPSLEWTV